MAENFALDVLICGAGAAGLTLAIDLARRGITFRLIDKLDEPFKGSRGKGIQPRTQEIFEDLGIIDKIAAVGGVYPPQREYRHDGNFVDNRIVEDGKPTPAEPYRSPLMVPQFLTERVMRDRLAELGYTPEFGCALIGFDQDPNGVTARVLSKVGEEIVRARYLVGADGGRSFVRQELKIGFAGKTLGVRAVVADVMLAGLSRDAWHRFNEGSMEQQISICPLAGTEMFQIQAPIPLAGDIDLSVKGLQAMVDERTNRSAVQVQSVSWALAFHMNARLADCYRVGRIFIVGDAAHVHPPTGGQGLNTSIQDSYNLGWKLSAVLNGAPAALLDSYDEERRAVAAGVLGLSTKLLDDARRGDMRRGRETHQLDLGYSRSTLALENPERTRGLAAGDRAPDASVRGAGGHAKRLFDLFNGTHWTLLGYEAALGAVSPRRGLEIHRIGSFSEYVDDQSHLSATYQLARGDWVLVRPDGYIGAIVAAEATAELDTYFQKVGLALDRP